MTARVQNKTKIRCAARASTRVLRDLLLTTPPSIEASPYRAALRGVLTVGSLGHPSLKTEGNVLALTSKVTDRAYRRQQKRFALAVTNRQLEASYK